MIMKSNWGRDNEIVGFYSTKVKNDYDKLHDFLEAFEYFHKEADLLSISFHGIPSEYP